MGVRMKKVERDGKIAVIVASEFGTRWYSKHRNYKLLFDPVIVALIQKYSYGSEEVIFDLKCGEEIEEYCLKKYYPEVKYFGDSTDLKIVWIPKGVKFKIINVGGFEEAFVDDPSNEWIKA